MHDTCTLKEEMGVGEHLSEEMSKALAEHHGWSREYADGFVAGEASCEKGEPLSRYVMVGIDDWALGFRTGYFRRLGSDSARVPIAGTPTMAQKRRSSELIDYLNPLEGYL